VHVLQVVRGSLGFEASGRPAKSTTAIVEKLRRESIRLSQMQDIAGLRIIVRGPREQDSAVDRIRAAFERSTIVDRRNQPSHGYRAIHAVVEVNTLPVEVQVRTTLQHRWAELSEKLADVIDPAIKYGGGDSGIRALLAQMTDEVTSIEDAEREVDGCERYIEDSNRKADRLASEILDIEEQITTANLRIDLTALTKEFELSLERKSAMTQRLREARSLISALQLGLNGKFDALIEHINKSQGF
jgi:ppGpp synthetase/RelA/SpoT-type nucleotidyltranferase